MKTSNKIITLSMLTLSLMSAGVPAVSTLTAHADDTAVATGGNNASTNSANDVSDTNSSSDDSSDEDTVNEVWGKPTVAFGQALNASQRQQTLKLLGVKDANNVKETTATGTDLQTYLHEGNGDGSSMISSVWVTREDKGKGINVRILTPENITQITADEYKQPLVTAGITDATVKVASVSKVTGESALTGVYKAFASNGEKVDSDRAALGNEELTTANEVSKNVADQNAKSGESTGTNSDANKAAADKVGSVLADTKTQLADKTNNGKDPVTKEEVEQIVNDAIAKNGLKGTLSQDDIDKLVGLAQKYQSTKGVLSKESLDQLSGIKDQLKENGNKLADSLKNLENQHEGFLSNMWNNVKSFFSNLFGGH